MLVAVIQQHYLTKTILPQLVKAERWLPEPHPVMITHNLFSVWICDLRCEYSSQDDNTLWQKLHENVLLMLTTR